MSRRLYHVSCVYNNHSIMEKGLIPGYKLAYEEEKSKYIFLSKKKPSSRIEHFPKIPENILEQYLFDMSYRHDECPLYNLYEINPEGLDPSLIHPTNDKRQVAYEGVIHPRYITPIRIYDANSLNERYEFLHRKNWWEQL